MIKNGIKIKSSISINEIVGVLKHKFDLNFSHSKGDVHNFPEIIFALDNKLYLTVDNENFILNEGDMLIYAPNSYHKSSKPFSATALIIAFRISYSKISEYCNKVITLNHDSRFFFIKLMEEALDYFSFKNLDNNDSILVANKGITAEETEMIKKKLEAFILMLSKQIDDGKKHKPNSEILAIIESFNANIQNNYSNVELAKLNSISESKLKYLFRENFNTSPYAYFQKLKIEHAKTLLRESEKNITEISEMLGFQTIHYFSRFFKKHVGISPKEYKKIETTLEGMLDS